MCLEYRAVKVSHTPGWKRSFIRPFLHAVKQTNNLLAIILIFGIRTTVKQLWRLAVFRAQLARHWTWPKYPSPSIGAIAEKYGMEVRRFSGVNDQETLDWFRDLDVDLVINQATGILREPFLAIPRIGTLNRYNALLPKNRGRFSTFWSVFKGEKRTGVSIHFVERELDSGPIIVQSAFPIGSRDTVEEVARRCYAIAPGAMIEALDRLERDNARLLPNSDAESTYNTNPTLVQALEYRWWRIRRALSSSDES